MASVGSDSGDSVALNVMPMLDIFSILILFLLISFSTDPINHDVSKDVTLPDSDTTVSLDEIPSLVVSAREILVNGKKVADVVAGAVPDQDMKQGAIYPLYTELTALAEANKRFVKDKEKPGTLAVEIDKNHYFKIIRQVMLSAQQADFIDFKLLVAKTKA